MNNYIILNDDDEEMLKIKYQRPSTCALSLYKKLSRKIGFKNDLIITLVNEKTLKKYKYQCFCIERPEPKIINFNDKQIINKYVYIVSKV